MEIKPKMIDFYMSVARGSSELSVARRLQVGAVIVKDNNIISFSWNGTPPGWDNNCEHEEADGTLKTKPEVIHAEANAILKVAKSNESCNQASIFTTHSPCHECAKMIIGSGIKEVFYSEMYRDDTGIRLLEKSGIKVKKVD
jgi:dCMP deaminase